MNNKTACLNMIKQQLRTGNVLQDNILNLYHEIPRHAFVPPQYSHFAYADLQIPLAHEERMLTPLEEATILQALDLKGHETVVEIGTGTGFLTALLSKLCHKVISIDYYSTFTSQAAILLDAHHCTNVELITGDACKGWLDKAPYEVVIYTGGLEQLTQTHFLQILPGGKLLAIEGTAPVLHARLFTLDHEEKWQNQLLFETNIPLLVDKFKRETFSF